MFIILSKFLGVKSHFFGVKVTPNIHENTANQNGAEFYFSKE